MSIIKEDGMNLNAIQDVFMTTGLVATIDENDGLVKVIIPDDIELAIWTKDELLKMRVVLISRKEMKKMGIDDDFKIKFNLNLGRLNTTNPLGLTWEYNLHLGGGILQNTILESAKMLSKEAEFIREYFEEI